MKIILFVWIAFLSVFISADAYSAQGEYWEITSKMEMKGMPFAMPATTHKVCLPPGGEKDPQRTRDKDSKCTFADVQRSGNTVKYKGNCVNSRGDTMNMEGETTHDSNSFKTKMQMSGEDHGSAVNMTMNSSGKRIGGSCDAEEISKKMQAQAQEQGQQLEKQQKDAMAQMCDVSNRKAKELVDEGSRFIGPNAICKDKGKKEEFCQAIRNGISHDVETFERLSQHEKISVDTVNNGDLAIPSVAKACNMNIESTKNALCKAKAHSGPQSFLETHCPAEAKAFRELARKREECQGRGYTSGEKMKACMGGAMAEEDTGGGSNDADTKKTKSGKQKADEEKSDSKSSSTTGNPTADTVLEGAKKLKGLFKF